MTGFTSPSHTDTESLLRESEQRGARIRDLNERTAALVGTGRAADGRVTVTWTSGDGLADVSIDPRAMRMPSADLAEAVRAAVREALDDLRRQVREVMTEVFGEAAGDPKSSRSRLHDAQDAFSRRMNDVVGELERARSGLRRH